MSEKSIAIVLGGTSPHIALIENLKNRGYYTVLVDYLENPPAKPFADEHIMISTLDKEAVLEAARKIKASVVINLLLDQPIVTAAYVSEKLNLPSLISYETAQLVTNKGLMKKRMIENQIPTARYCIINNSDITENLNLNYPLIAKPVGGTGSLGVKKVSCFNELKTYLHDNLKEESSDGIIVEECYKGIEINVSCFVKDKIAHIIMIRQKEVITVEEKYDMVFLGTIIPAQISLQAEKEIYATVQKIVKAFELDNIPLHLQAFVDGNTVNIIEIAARIGGGLSSKTIKMANGFDIIDYSIDVLFGKEEELHYNTLNCIYSTVIIYAQSSVFGKITGLEKLVEQNLIEGFDILKTKGMVIPQGVSARNRVCALIISAESLEKMAEKINEAFQRIDVLDAKGNSVMMKNLKKSVVYK